MIAGEHVTIRQTVEGGTMSRMRLSCLSESVITTRATGAEGNRAPNQLLVPRLLWDIGAHHGAAGRVHPGLE